jgi:uncharacterized protein YjdB
MMFSISRTATAWLLAGATMIAAGCAGDDGTAPGTAGPVTGSGRVTISPKLDSIRIGQSRQLTAGVVDQQGAPSTAEVQWSSAEPSIASVSTAGLVTAVAAGTARVIARSGEAADTARIVVLAEAVPFYVTPNAASVMLGEKLQLNVSASGASHVAAVSDAQVAWASSDPAIATVNPDGVVQTLGVGDVTLTATINKVTSAAAVRVNKANVDAVTLTPTNSTIDPGQSVVLDARVLDEMGRTLSGKKLNWRSSNDAVAKVDNGTVIGSTKGSAVITAQVEGKRASATINVLAVPVATIAVALGDPTLSIGQTTTASATLKDANGNVLTQRTIAWQSSNPAIVTVNSAGLVTAIAAGNATITGISEGKTATAPLSVTPQTATAIVITPGGVTLAPNATGQLAAQVRDANGATLSRPVTWTSDNTGIATVSSSGLVTARAAGSASVTATADGVSASVPVTVAAPDNAVATVSVTLQSTSLVAGQSTQASAVARNAAGTVVSGGPVSWSSMDEEIATVSSTGAVSTKKAGSVTIAATIDGVIGMQTLAVNPPPLAPVASVSLSAPSTSLQVGQTAQITATIVDANGNTVTGRSIGWSSTNPTVVTVSVTGVVTAVGSGSATISATSEGKTGTLAMTVASAITPPPPPPPTVASITVQLASTSVQAGGSTAATAIAKDANGNPIGGIAFAWSSSNGGVATVTSSGAVSAIAAGTASIVATGGGKTGSATLTVTAPATPPPPPPPPGSVPTGLTGVRLLAGPIPTVAESKALGATFAEYEDDFPRYADYHWAAHGANWEYANYYDRAATYFVWYARTGNQTYLDRGSAIAIDYRTKFLESQAMPYTYNSSTYWHMPFGLALHYLLTGDEKSRQAVGYSAEWVGALHMVNEMNKMTTMALPGTARTQSPIGPTLSDPITVGTAENPWRARVLQAFVLSHAINAPQNGPATGYGNGGVVSAVPGTWAEKAKIALDLILQAQNPDGSYRDVTSGGAEKPFMDGLLNDALILYYQFVAQDSRILSAVKRNLDYNWANVWLGHRENSPTFAYYEWSYTSPVDPNWAGGRYPAGDLNLMMVNAFGWVYSMTGDVAYRDRGNQVFKGGVDLGYVEGSKQFNQMYHGSWRFIGYRVGRP